jgi:hypothetical protein
MMVASRWALEIKLVNLLAVVMTDLILNSYKGKWTNFLASVQLLLMSTLRSCKIRHSSKRMMLSNSRTTVIIQEANTSRVVTNLKIKVLIKTIIINRRLTITATNLLLDLCNSLKEEMLQ